MASNKNIRFGPVALGAAAANVINPGTTTGGVGLGAPQNLFAIIKHIRVVNKTGAPVNVTAYIGITGGSAAGTEFLWNATPVPANSFLEAFPQTPLEVADFLTALAGAITSLTIEGTVELGVR
jgi:hypothetical protein